MYARPSVLIDSVGVRAGLADPGEHNTNTTITANAAYWMQFFVPFRFELNRLGANFATAGTNVDLGIYADGGTAPGAWIVSTGSVAVGGTGNRLFTCTTTIIEPGLYWMAYSADNVTTGVRCSTLASSISYRQAKTKTSSFPLTTGTPAGLSVAGVVPMVWAERA